MAQNRFYSSTAAKTTLTGLINNSQTNFTVTALTGYPVSLPFTAILERDTVNEEVITVTGVSGTTITSCIRGVDGTSAISHTAGATFEHGVSARDFNEPQVHIAASSAVHGLTGSVVGTSDTQTLTNKTLAAPAFTGTATGLSAASAILDAASTLGGITGTTLSGERGAFASFSPSFACGSTPTQTVSSAYYLQVGKLVVAYFQINITSSPSAGDFVLSGLPVNSRAATAVFPTGVFIHSRNAGSYQLGNLYRASATTMKFLRSGDSEPLNNTLDSVGSGDYVAGLMIYESA